MNTKTLLFALLASIAFFSCDDEDNGGPSPSDQKKTEGFVINAQTPSQSFLVKYSDSLPAGTFDISDGKDFQSFFPVDAFDHALFMSSVNDQGGFSKVEVNGNGEVVERSLLPTVGEDAFQIAIRRADFGVLQDRNNPNEISTFNPQNMKVTGTIDMSQGQVPGNDPHRYETFYFRNERLYAPIRGDDGSFYDSLIVHVANLNTGQFDKTITGSKGHGNPDNDFGQHDQDESGNLFVADQGDFQTSQPAGLHRINAGETDFDTSYTWYPAQKLNPANVGLPIFRGFYYMANGKALALVATETPQEVLQIVQQAGGFSNLTTDQINKILGIFNESANAAWSVLDLNAKTVTPIDGIPQQSIFGPNTVTPHNGHFYLPVVNNDNNALYQYNPDNGETSKQFELEGGEFLGAYNLAVNN